MAALEPVRPRAWSGSGSDPGRFRAGRAGARSVRSRLGPVTGKISCQKVLRLARLLIRLSNCEITRSRRAHAAHFGQEV